MVKLAPQIENVLKGVNQVTSIPDEAELAKQGADTLKSVLKVEALTDGSAKANSLEIRLSNEENVRQINKTLNKNKDTLESIPSPIFSVKVSGPDCNKAKEIEEAI